MIKAGNRPLVTYVLLSYNHARYVRQAIESIVNQNYSPLQLVVVDDGSTDDSIKILHAMQDQYGFEILTQANSGVVAALNRGISMAHGDFIVPHASDDISHPGRTLAQVELLTSNPGAGFTVGGVRKVSSHGVILEDWPTPRRFVTTFEDFREGRGKAIAVSCMYRATAIKKIGKLDESLSFEDVQLYWNITALGYECLIDLGVRAVDYRIIPGSLGRRYQVPHFRSFLTFLEKYRQEPWYPRAHSRAMAGMLGALAEHDREAALQFLSRNRRTLDLFGTVRGVVKIALPRSLLVRLKKPY